MTTTIDGAWLSSHGGAGGPWSITAADTYELAVDPVASGTGFLVNVSGVTLDLKGHTVTFNDRASPAVTDPHFTSGASLSPAWDFSGAPAASAAPTSEDANVYRGFAGWTDHCLKLGSFNTEQVVLSPPITLPAAHVEYCASVFCKAVGNGSASGINLRLEVVDVATGRVIGSSDTTTGVGSGYNEPCFFVPSDAGPVRLRITCTPPTGLSTTFYLAYAAVEPSRDCGVVCTGSFSIDGSVTGATNAAPIQITTSQGHAFPATGRVTVTGVGGNTAANGYWAFTRVDTTKFTLDGSSGNAPYTSGGKVSINGNVSTIDGPYKVCTQLSNGVGGSPTYTRLTGQSSFRLVDTVGSGLVVSGKGGHRATPVRLHALASVTVSGVRVSSAGMDAAGIDVSQGTSATVVRCQATGGGTRISSRQRLKGHVGAESMFGDTLLDDNFVLDTNVCGVYCSTAATAPSGTAPRVTNNRVFPATRYTDQYGIVLNGMLYGCTLAGNLVDSTAPGRRGRGILVDLVGTYTVARDVLCSGNVVNCYDTWNLEYPRATLQTTGIRVRSFDGKDITGYRILHNTVTVATDGSGTVGAIGIRPTLDNSVDADMVVSGNVVTCVNNDASISDSGVNSRGATTNRGSYAVAFGLDGLGHPGGVSCKGNTWASNDIGVDLGDKDAFQVALYGITFEGDVFKRHTASGNQNIAYVPVVVGDFTCSVSGTKIVGPTYVNTTAPDLSQDAYWGNYAGFDKKLLLGWRLAVAAVDAANGAAVPGASCTLTNADSAQDDAGAADGAGRRTLVAVTDLWHQSGNHAGGRTHTAYTPHTLSVSAPGYTPRSFSVGSLAADSGVTVHLSRSRRQRQPAGPRGPRARSAAGARAPYAGRSPA